MGMRDAFGLPAFMVAASMLGYGAMVHSAGMSLPIAIVSTLGIWGLPGQVAFVEYILLGAPMSLSLVPMFRGSESGWRWRYLWVQFMSVNTWIGLLRRIPELSPDQRGPFFAGFSTNCMIAGVVGVSTGYLMAETLPFYVTVSLVFLNPIYFAFVFAAMRVRACLLAFAAGAVTGPLIYLLTPDWSLPISGIIAGSVGYYADRILKGRA